MRYIDVCSGISAPTMAWKPLGWQALCFAEIEAAPRSVLSHHYPEVPLHGDFTQIKGDEHGPVDLLVGGTPCQSFSVAGLRGGLADERGNLALEYLRLADRARPRWLVWENVPGVLSSNSGRDFGTFLGGLAELGYGFAYAVLDAQHFGVPQRRRRVFVVGYIGDWRRAAAVLLERHSLQGHPPPRREKGEGVARPIAAGSARGSGYRNDADTADNLICGALTPGAHPGSYNGQDAYTGRLIASFAQIGNGEYAPGVGTMRAAGGDCHGGSETLIAHSLRAEGFDASEDGTGRGTPLVPVIVDTLTSNGDAHSGYRDEKGLIPICFNGQMSEASWSIGQAKTLQAKNPRVVAIRSAVRRLTPRECERLQGFPDDFTLVPHRGKPMADGPRYKMLGNSMAVPCIRWLGERIAAVEAIGAERQAA